jgi:hypothetical protein
MGPQQIAEMRKAFLAFMARRPAAVEAVAANAKPGAPLSAVVLPYKPTKKLNMARATLKAGRPRQAIAVAR